ncbi:transcriptional regulator [Roseomonas sp. SSH11]|uniref:Transcriptional regulator n=1 Tax=Pararoseomonas baculiformis TaxID=2820812 RepID=A0ABS4ALA1_9PROT|nr:transcriptional regulator [Pararoseomonas baculiformis]MBP0447798.1 transcriptional regulator [Pararoseomonas baculiformis]
MLVFVDFEASSLAPGSYPVEVGWVAEHGEGEAHLIRPAPDWVEWSAESEAVHGLARERLVREGEPAEDVARRVLDVLGAAGVVVVSDAAKWEQLWLDRLMRAAGLVHSIRIVELEREILLPEARRILQLASVKGGPGQHVARGAWLDRASEIVGDAQHASRNGGRVQHRALADAEGMRSWWLEVGKRVAQVMGER